MGIKRRLYLILLSIIMIVAFGSSGYYIILNGKESYLDCVYMTVISLTTVGYGEVIDITGNTIAKVFTMMLITLGMGIILYGISTITALIIEGELSGILRKNKMAKQIDKLSRHYVVCGGGQTGRPLAAELVSNRETVVLIERDSDKLERCKQIEGLFYIEGDATDDQNLLKAGIERAAGIIICLPSDKDNLYITMTSRMLNPHMRIVSRMTDPILKEKLKKAGADRVVSPNVIGALRMASEMIRPTAVDFLDMMLRSQKGTMRISEVGISDDSIAIGKTLKDCGLNEQYQLLVLGVRRPGDEIIFNPSPDEIIRRGMKMVVMGDVDKIAKARSVF